MAKQNIFDAIVVGSGISGGWAAKELTEKGLKTILLERGRNVEHIKDYEGTEKNPWELEHRNGATQEDKHNSPIQSKCYAYDEVSKKFFVNDNDHPYNAVKPFDWIRGNHVGGVHSCGVVKATAGVHSILNLTQKMVMVQIGLFVITI